MHDGFIKVATATPPVRVADVAFNTEQIIAAVREAAAHGAKLIVFPELSVTAYTCGDLFLQGGLIRRAQEAVLRIAEETAALDILSVVGLPLAIGGKLYNAAAFLKGGEALGFATKSNLPNYTEFYEQRYFSVLPENTAVRFGGKDVPAGPKLLFPCRQMEAFCVAGEICEDMWTPVPPGSHHAQNGATVLVNLSASDEVVAKPELRHILVRSHSMRTTTAYLYADAGPGESTADLVFAGHNMIYENGLLLGETRPFQTGALYADIDVDKLVLERRRMSTFPQEADASYLKIPFDIQVAETSLERYFPPHPFVPQDEKTRAERCASILDMQSHGLQKRLQHTRCTTAVIGISGGLDSTLALLVTASAFDALELPRSGIKAVTMPCFGTTDRTYQNAVRLIRAVGADFKEVNIEKSVLQHFADIGADKDVHNTTYENAQARERTQVLMDIANQTGGLVIGTGDLSELALGWATYNGDHMSMYGVNCSVPKTLVRHLVRYAAEQGDAFLRETLEDILDTPVSPELLPPTQNGTISQATEELVGPYELHDFFLYYFVRFGFEKTKIRRICEIAFDGVYDKAAIQKWIDVFYRRFFANQFKRSCVPDGPKVGSVSLSPRGDWRMPSDACLFYE